MPTNYTPNAGNNPSSISLPSDLDAATAESVNVALRALGDKSAFAVATSAAIASMNTFTRGQVVNPNVENEAILACSNFPSDITADNRWLLLFKFNIEENRTLRMYTGGLTGIGRMAWTLNAHWSVTNQEWELEDSGANASAIIWRGDNLSVYHAAAGSSPFASWPTTTDSGGEVGSLRCAGEFRYLNPKTRFRTIPVTHACGPISVSGADGSVGAAVLGVHNYIRWPIQLPPGAVFQRVKVMHSVAESAAETFRITRRRTVWDEGDPVEPAESVLATQASSSSNGSQITTISAPGTSVDRYDELSLLWEPAAVLHGNVNSILVEWLDQGPTPI